jgi:hypothetical protein
MAVNQGLVNHEVDLFQVGIRHFAKCRLVVHITIPVRRINWIDRQTSNLEVAGSSPAAPAKSLTFEQLFDAIVAIVVEADE